MPIIMPSPRTGKEPKIHEDAYIAPNATIIGDVTIEEGVNVWFGAVIRADWGTIKIGKNTSIQEHVAIHTEVGTECIIGSNCIIGHHAMVHGPCIIEDGCLIGIGARVINKSKIGEGSLIGAGAVVTNKEIPPRSLAVGIPAEVKKQLPESKKPIGMQTSGEYVKNGKVFKEFFEKNPQYLKY
ncbi:MAG: gamma carbonic anhydrase family protein [Promethearchaeia archaeon]